VVPDVLLPAVTCQAEFVPYFLNLLRDWTAAVWSVSTPLKAQTPVQGGNHNSSNHHSFRSVDVTPSYVSDERTRSFTPDSNPRLESRLSSTQRLNSAKSHPRGLNDISLCIPSPQEVNIGERPLHSTKHDFARHRPLRQRNTVLNTEHVNSSAKECQRRALFSDTSVQSGSCSIRKSAGKHKSQVGNRNEKVDKTAVPSFNLDSNVDFPDMKSSQRYYFYFIWIWCSWQWDCKLI